MAQDEFYNPYQFIPVGETGNPDAPWPLGEGPPKADDFRQAREAFTGSRFSHASYATGKDIWHGRIICRLSLKDPVFIGADRYREKLPDGKDEDGNDKTKDGYAVIAPFMLGSEPAVPASSLRGLISSLAEAASGSALRVLHNRRPVSYRQPHQKALSAIGMIVEDSSCDSGFALKPLTLPFVEYRSDDGGRQTISFREKQELWSKAFRNYANLRVYLRRRLSVKKQTDRYLMQAFRGDSFPENGVVDWSFDPKRQGHLLLGQYATDEWPVEEKGLCKQERNQGAWRWPQVRRSANIPDGWVSGFVRVLYHDSRKIETGRHYEIFVPAPEDLTCQISLPITTKAVANFYALAGERGRTNKDDASVYERLPFTPVHSRGEMQLDHDGENEIRLRTGQLVYFDVNAGRDSSTAAQRGDEEPLPVVSAVSFSSIWRGLVIKNPESDKSDPHIAGTWDFFRKYKRDGKEGEYLPFNSDRETISPAEWMFGFVSEDGAGEQADEEKAAQHVAYAGRVRISAARLAETPGSADDVFLGGDYTPQSPQDTEHSTCSRPRLVRLKTLAEPKPPSPAIYFKPDGNKPIAKHDLNTDDRPNGRKVYLHRDLNGGDLQPWKTEHPDENERLKNAVRPLDPQACHEHGDFWFHVDFDNLSEAELDLLCFALHPSDEFRHKLGMGKPIGLGKVHIEPVALFCIDRAARYGNGADVFAQARYAEAWLKGDHLPDRLYSSEAAAAQTTLKSCVERAKKHAERLEKRYPDAHRAIMLTGDPDKLKAGVPVHYPLRRDQNDPEQETFKWFVQNTKTDPQCLDPIKADQPGLYPLKRN
ncbi:MAG: TIGR03986 family CRISPR-associated RAMP protein [Rhodospirillales bacterium]|nr:TIGR03986 family CRISPR-associated RAMP protein [Rhodospirillales bacterium]